MVEDVGVVTKLNGDFTFNCLLIDSTKGYVRYIAQAHNLPAFRD